MFQIYTLQLELSIICSILVYLMFKFIQWSCQLFAISREDIQEDTIIITTKNSEHLLLEVHSLLFSSLTESMAMSLITG